MEPFVEADGSTAPLDRANVDTDQIIPKQFLKRIERTGFGEFLFFDWRNSDPDFVLEPARVPDAPILVAGANFGCGSSREHAPWALQDCGLPGDHRAVASPTSSAPTAPRSGCSASCSREATWPSCSAAAPAEVTVDLERQVVTLPSGREASFEVDPHTREDLLNGWDDIALTFNREDEIAAYERTRERKGPDAVALGA